MKRLDMVEQLKMRQQMVLGMNYGSALFWWIKSRGLSKPPIHLSSDNFDQTHFTMIDEPTGMAIEFLEQQGFSVEKSTEGHGQTVYKITWQ